MAIREAQKLVPQPKIIVFASFQFDPEAAKDIDETKWPNVTLLKVQMNTDLLTEDLKKKRSSNESFLLIGQPDVDLVKVEGGNIASLSTASTITTLRLASSSPAVLKRSPCGCSIPIMMAVACSHARSSSRCQVIKRDGQSSQRI